MSTYVYGIVTDSHPLDLSGLPAVGDPEGGVRALRAAGLVAVASTAPERLRAKRRHLLAHQAVLERLCAHGAVLPMRFGMLVSGDEVMTADLRSRAEHYASLLHHLRDRVELNVKAEHREEAVLREVLHQRQDLRATKEALSGRGGGTFGERMAFGESVAHAVSDRGHADAEWLVSVLGPHAEEVNLGPSVNGCFCNVSLLVGRDRVADVRHEVARLQETAGELMRIRLQGPLPPYSFVTGQRMATRGET